MLFFRTDPCRMDIGIAPDDDGAGLRGKTMRRSMPGLRNVRVGPEEKSNGRLRKSGGSERRRTGSGRYCGPGGARGGGGSELRRVFESGKFGPGSVVRLCGCAGRNRPFVPERFPDRSGRHDEENARKTTEGTVPGYFPAGPFGRVWGGDYSTVSETRKSSPEAGSVTTMLRSSLVKWK